MERFLYFGLARSVMQFDGLVLQSRLGVEHVRNGFYCVFPINSFTLIQSSLQLCVPMSRVNLPAICVH